MYCKKCGGQIDDGAKFCKHCGAVIDQPEAAEGTASTININVQAQTTTPTNAVLLYPRQTNSGLLQAAFIINLICTICMGVFVIPLAWCIPMTVHSYGIYKGTKPNTTGFAVCTLIFLSVISGILMLVADKDE